MSERKEFIQMLNGMQSSYRCSSVFRKMEKEYYANECS